jgi:hypothetical protein
MLKKSIIGTVTGVLLTVGLVGSAFAADSSQATAPATKAGHQAKLEAKAAAKGLTVAQWTEKHKAAKAALEQKAQAAGLTVEQFRQQKKDVHQAKLQQKAAHKAERKAKHEQKKQAKQAAQKPVPSTQQ